ncbi:MAG: 4-diphosphocytidyl-2-C-methyl-D-erythritol kinase [Hyphomicrobiaceae bacterium]
MTSQVDAPTPADGEPRRAIAEFAAAKINLTLEIDGRRADGYHALRSLVAFARDAGDELTLTPGPELSLETTGPEAPAIEGPNLVTATAQAVRFAIPSSTTGAFLLEKHLPVASGIGGGSADAAAAIRALARANAIDDPAKEFAQLAVSLGADIPVCIGGPFSIGSPVCTAAYMSGIGDKVWRPATGTLLPPEGLAALLVNPRIAVPTGAVFKALAAPALTDQRPAEPPAPFITSDDCLSYIAASRNDLEAPAVAIAPIIAEVLSALRKLPGCRLARMSGSGATCFALLDDIEAAEHAAHALGQIQPQWWIKATRLG